MRASIDAMIPRSGLFALSREDLHCVFKRDPAARTRLAGLTTYPDLHVLIAHRLADALWRRNWRYLARFLGFLTRAITQVGMDSGTRIGRRFFIDHSWAVVTNETAEIGDGVTLYHGVTLDGVSWNPGMCHPTLGNGGVVGAGARALGPISVSRHTRIGANSVVIQHVPAQMTVIDIPGRVSLPLANRRIAEHGIDHHLLPDPVGKAVACLLEHITRLVSPLAAVTGKRVPVSGDCDVCVDGCDPVQVSVSDNLKRNPTDQWMPPRINL